MPRRSTTNASGDQTEIKNRTAYQTQCLITDLLAELAIILNEKSKLENENANLKIECLELKQKLIDYERTMQDQKTSLLQNVEKTEEKIKQKEINLAKKDVRYLEEQKKCLMEVNHLKLAYIKQKDSFQKREAEFTDKIKLLNVKMIETSNAYETMKELADCNQKKYITYKAKVKLAKSIIKRLTMEINKNSQKKITLSKGCQTQIGSERMYSNRHRISYLEGKDTEDNILAELFFKQNLSDSDIENIFFT